MSDGRFYEHDTENQLRFDIEVSIEYHRRRAQFLYQFDRLSKLIAVISGSSFVFKILSDDVAIALLGASSAIIALTSLIFRVSEKASEHIEAMKNFSELHSMVLHTNYGIPDAELTAKIEKQRKEIEAKNHYVLNGLAHVCWNEIAKGWGRPQRFKINYIQKVLSQFFDIQSNFTMFRIT